MILLMDKTNWPDFAKDYANLLASDLTSQGVSFPSDLLDDSTYFLSKYISYASRTISKKRRKTHLSNYLLSSPQYITHQNIVENLKKISEDGGDLSHYQSKSIERFNYKERMFFDWSILHLHLGNPTNSRFSQRSGPLLFLTVSETDAYFIAIRGHGAWGEQLFLNIVDQEWQHLTDSFVLQGAISISPTLSPRETIEARKAGIQAIVQIRQGRCLMPTGGGITTNGDSMAAMLQAQQIVADLRKLEEMVYTNKCFYCNNLKVTKWQDIMLRNVESNGKVLLVNRNYPNSYQIPSKIPSAGML